MLDDSRRVVIGDPQAGCDGNRVTGPVTVTGTVGTVVIAGNTITAVLRCTSNAMNPIDHGVPNHVTGPTKDQCSDM